MKILNILIIQNNLIDKDVEIIDIFIGEPGSPFIEILEPKWDFERLGRFSK